MSTQFPTRFLPVLVLGAMAWTTPARAQDRYDSGYEHYSRDRHEAQEHRWEDRRESLGHAIGDLFRYGTTDPYSSPEHYYRDRQREAEHSFRDWDRAWDHHRRDQWNSQWSGDYRWNRDYDRNDHYRRDDYRRDDYRRDRRR